MKKLQKSKKISQKKIKKIHKKMEENNDFVTYRDCSLVCNICILDEVVVLYFSLVQA